MVQPGYNDFNFPNQHSFSIEFVQGKPEPCYTDFIHSYLHVVCEIPFYSLRLKLCSTVQGSHRCINRQGQSKGRFHDYNP